MKRMFSFDPKHALYVDRVMSVMSSHNEEVARNSFHAGEVTHRGVCGRESSVETGGLTQSPCPPAVLCQTYKFTCDTMCGLEALHKHPNSSENRSKANLWPTLEIILVPLIIKFILCNNSVFTLGLVMR